MAVSVPSCSAPSRTRWIEAGRWVVTWNICWRVSTIRTGRASSLEASAARMESALTGSLPPKPPPTYSEITSTLSGDSMSVLAIDLCALSTSCSDARIVSLPSCHAARLPCGSIIAWLW